MPASEDMAENDHENIATQNLAVAEAIKQYCDYPKSQQFALMIDGPWGSGKTYLINSVLPSLTQVDAKRKERKPLYISLYGITNAAEIDEQIHQQLHPYLTHRYTRIVGIVFKGLLKTAIKVDFDKQNDKVIVNSQIPDLKLEDFVSDAPGRILIFDDFERAVMPPVGVLAYINHLVEHDDCKVIVLANEPEVLNSKLLGKDAIAAYRTQKEKTVGRTLLVKADTRSAYSTLISDVENVEARAFLEANGDIFLTIFRDSKSENLRLLRQFFWDFERLWSVLSDQQRAHKVGMREIAGVLYALTLEVKAGNLEADGPLRYGILQRMQTLNGTADKKTIAAAEIGKRYPSVNFDSNILSEYTIRQIIQHSVINPNDIQRQIQGHPYFMEPGEQPTWRTLWNSSKLNKASLEETLHWFVEDFKQRSFQTTGEILHIIGLSLWLSDIGQEGWAPSEIKERLENYINDVCNSADWDALIPATGSLDMNMGSAFGHMFYSRSNEHFTPLVIYFDTAVNAARRRQYGTVADGLKALMISDSEAFLRQVCFTNAGPSTYAKFGVLSLIPPSEFASIFLSLPYEDMSQVAMALSMRYEQALVYEEIGTERSWLVAVHDRIVGSLPHLDPVPRYHVNNLIIGYLVKHLPKSEPTPPPTSTTGEPIVGSKVIAKDPCGSACYRDPSFIRP